MVLPSGFALPPFPYLLALVVGVIVVGGLLYRRTPRVTQPVVLGLVPWILVGAGLHVLYQLGIPPDVVRPFLGTPAVYLSTFVVAGAIWLLAGDRAPTALAGTGSVAFLVVLGLTLSTGPIAPAWPAVGLVVSVGLAASTWVGLRRFRPVVAITGRVGGLVLFAHSLDGVSTAIGVDVLGFGERTPASRLVLEMAGRLPTADVIGTGWLFVLVKLAVASLVVWLFADYVREDPQRGYLLLALIAALGLGPGIHNLLLYTVA